jgi:hypothetical protein
MKAAVPYTFRTGAIVDAESVNGNLRQMAADVGRNLSRRYTYCQTTVPLTGMSSADNIASRTIFFRDPSGSLDAIDLVAVEAVIYSATGATWTVTVTNETVTDSFTINTAGATAKASGGITRLFSLSQATAYSNALWSPTSVTGYRISLSASAASTITAGYLVLHFRGDRANNASHAGYTPTLVQATTSSAGSILDTQLTSFENAVLRDTNNASDFRVECYLARNFATAQTWNVPSGSLRDGAASRCAVVGNVGESVQFAVTPNTTTVNANGTGGVVFGAITPGNRTDGPTTSANDTIVTLTPAGGTVELAYVFVVWR